MFQHSIIGFNPYRVFKLAATDASGHAQDRPAQVSIPIGFSSSLQLNAYVFFHEFSVLFQSLSGFQARCNKSPDFRSIIPSVVFQSLSGFQARCNR